MDDHSNPEHRAEADRFDRVLAFLRRAARLKDTLRSGRRTGDGALESVAAHSWSLCLLALLLEDDMDRVDMLQLLRLCILHDLGEAISGDVPAIDQDPAVDKSARERDDLLTLSDGLPEDIKHRILKLWAEYDAGETTEAQWAKGLDKIETMLQHVTGRQDADFDYLWNLGYGVKWTERTPLLKTLRAKVDVMTRAKAANFNGENPRA
ncbi:HD domain-containing protein [Marinovum sp. 2_MG-2023]|uniref:HD domain-containing protein n=1 Tax=unclassified Marinovum TaxID=2647166 RepID=UPI0026E39199|nr:MULTISPECIES: HD domain-containing protein [unclassified Marinovum]MDO6729424.1 HD domain-containing protein [Marinovum sp. 2_MG-2023]MDO6781340.1 HD domain-containing protein [Marinovum sp. 1_MG-2023]